MTALPSALAAAAPAQRIEALADPGSTHILPSFDARRGSPHLARWGITAQADDGVVIRAGRLAGKPVLFAAQDARFLGGSVGERHAAVLAALFAHAPPEAVHAIILLAASGGVRLHEANPAELALGQALRALLDRRAAGTPVIALACGDVFGGASVLACAADRLGMLPPARLGLSGPKVIATTRGSAELDPQDARAVQAIFGALARVGRGQADLVADDVQAVRGWLCAAIAAREDLAVAVAHEHDRLAAWLTGFPRTTALEWVLPASWRSVVEPVAAEAGLFRLRDGRAWIVAATGAHHVDAPRMHALDSALLAFVVRDGHPGDVLVLVEDSRGHEVSRQAEERCLSRFLAHHAAVLAVLRQRGIAVHALLAGQGHSAAFFAHGLQATRLHAVADSRVVAMERDAVARVTGLDSAALATCIERDPVLGQSAAAFAHWGGVREIVPAADRAALEALVRGADA